MNPTLGAPSDAALAAILASARRSRPSYDHEGSTLDPQARRRGARERSTVVGQGAAAFALARSALRTWVPQRSIGCRVLPADQEVEEGATILLVIPGGPFRAVARNRVVAVVDEERTFAYAYGTLPGHPERGEESFTVEHRPDDAVVLTIRCHAGAGTPLARLAAPIVRVLSSAALRAYVRAVERHVAEHEREVTP